MNKTFMKSLASTLAAPLCLSFLFTLATPSRAASLLPPERLTYQSFLVDGNGNALAPSAPKNYDVVFRIYGSATGNDLVWAEQQTVTVDKGNFSVLLGEGSQSGSEPHPALSSIFYTVTASDRYVAMTVKGIGPSNADVDILPRVQLLTSPYSFLARNAVSANSLANSGSSQIVTIDGSNVGINKPLPIAALDVVGAAVFSGNATAGNAFMGDVGHPNWAGFSHRQSATAAGYALLQNSSGLNTYINAKSGAGAGIEFRFDNAPKMSLDPNGGLFIANSLGIGMPAGGAGSISLRGANSGYNFEDRFSGQGSWSWYAQGGFARLYGAPANVDRLVIEQSTGKIGIPGGNTLEFGYGLSKEVNNGKIGYKTFTDGLDIIGAGNTSADRKITIHSQGGTTIHGAVFGKSYFDTTASDSGYYMGERGNFNSRYCIYGRDGGMSFWSSVANRDIMVMQNNGLIGINRAPRCPLDVGSSSDIYVGTYGYIAYGGSGGPYPLNGNAPFSIMAAQRVGGTEFNAFSDRRIKEVVSLSDTHKDLEIIKKLKVTDYRMLDKAAEGDSLKKGFIAQEVKEIVPEAVNRSTNFIPNIYAVAKSLALDKGNKSMALTMEKAPGLKKGELIRIITDLGEIEGPVLSVSSTNFVVGDVTLKEQPKFAFVFGKQVPDFLSVNYDRLFTSGIGAMQEMAKKLEASETRVAQLEVKAHRVEKLEGELSELKQLVAKLAQQAEKRAASAGGPNLAAAAAR
jgi:hypothetical protein